MGTIGMLDPCRCPRCDQASGLNSEHSACAECRRQIWLIRLEAMIMPPLLRGQGLSLLTIPFLTFTERQILTDILYNRVLRQRQSPFRAFTYFRNGTAGNISPTEDIIDRILSYLYINPRYLHQPP
jgi:hypothetical protein